jgi:hypothetical protein
MEAKAHLFGGSNATMEEVRAVVAPDPTESWNPISHARFLDVVNEVIQARGMHLGAETLRLAGDNHRLFGVGLLTEGIPGIPGIENPDPDALRLALGFVNATDKSLSARILGGSSVSICENLMMSSEHRVTGKHTRHVEDTMRRRFDGILDQIIARHQRDVTTADNWRAEKISRPEVAELILDVNRAGGIPLRFMQPVMAEFTEPTSDHGDTGTVWSAFNAFTAVGRERFHRNPFTASDETLVIDNLFSERFAALAA